MFDAPNIAGGARGRVRPRVLLLLALFMLFTGPAHGRMLVGANLNECVCCAVSVCVRVHVVC